MAIKNKDGTIYILSHPNPLMITQDTNEGKYSLHNFEIGVYEKEEINTVMKQKTSIQYEVSDVVIEKINTKTLEEKPLYTLVTINCLPAEAIRTKDALYDEVKVNVQYKNPIKINVFISKSEDIVFQCWCQTQLGVETILHQGEERRWWVIKEITEKDGWYLYTCITSLLCPHFV